MYMKQKFGLAWIQIKNLMDTVLFMLSGIFSVMFFFVFSLNSMLYFFLYVCHDSRQTIDVWDKFKYAENCSW